MYIFFQALFLFIALCVVSLLITFYFTVIQLQGGRHPEPSLTNIIAVQMSLLTTTLFDASGDIVSQVTATSFGLSANVFSNGKKFAQLAVLTFILLEVSNNTNLVLTAGDSCWRCAIQPLFQNVLLAVGQVLRVIYDGLIPLYNYNYIMVSQATKGSIAIAIKCDLRTVVDTIRLIINMWISTFQSIFMWTGVAAPSAENNIFTNELDIVDVVNKTQAIFSKQQDVLDCVCEGLAPVFDIAFTVVRQKELPLAVNHLFNFPIAALQTVFQLLPLFGPKFPTMNAPLYHLNGFIYNIAKYADVVVENVARKTIQLFVDDFDLQGLPEEFIFTTMSRAVMTSTNLAHTLYRTSVHIMMPLPKYITNPDYMMKAMQINEAMREADLFLLNIFNIGYWFLEVIDKFSKSLVKSVVTGNEFKIVGLPAHVRLTCEPSKKWTDTTVCLPYLFLSSGLNTVYLFWNLATELLWKSVFTQQQSFIHTLQRYDGPSYPRNEAISCRYRKRIKWDLTTPGRCMCDIPVGYRQPIFTEEHPFGEPVYDPWCGQPNLQANVLGNIHRMAMQLQSGGGLTGAASTVITTLVELSLEITRIILKTVLNAGDIVLGQYFQYKNNCGYGVSEAVLEKTWEEAGNVIKACSPPKAGYMLDAWNDCVPMHNYIRHKQCAVTANDANLAPLCEGENKEGCQCNIGLPMDDRSLCKCIFEFPDTGQEMAQTAFENKILSGTYANSPHWCQTYHFEWLFRTLDNFAFTIDRIFASFHPAYDTEANSYCEEMSYALTETTVLAYSRTAFDRQKALYDAIDLTYVTKSCKIYGSHDFICSASMTIRSAVRLIIYEMREIVTVVLELIAGSSKGITVNLGNRLCDLQRAIAGLASTTSSILPVGFVSDGVRIGFAKIIFTIFDSPIEALNMVNQAIQFILRILEGLLTGRGNQQAVFDFLISEVDIIVDWIRSLIDGFYQLFEGIHRGAGGFFALLDKIIVIVRSLLTDVAIELIALIMKIFGGMIQMFTGGGIYADFFKDLWTFITKFILMLLQNVGKVIDAILTMLGPVGSFIRNFASEVCGALQGVICGLSMGSFCDLGCMGMGPSRLRATLGATHHHNVSFDGIFGHHLDSGIHELPRILHDELEWTGTSDCDMYVHGYKDYNFTDLRPMERVHLLQCVEQRALAVEMGKQLNVNLPHDLIYNWKRKYVMLYHLLQSGIIYTQYTVSEIDAKEMIAKMKEAGVDTELYLPLWNKARLTAKTFVSLTHIDRFVHELFHRFDENIKTSDTGWGHVYRIYAHTSKAAKEIYNATTSVDLNYEIKQTSKAFTKVNLTIPSIIPEHVKTAYNYMGKATVRASKTNSFSKLKSRRFILEAAGMNTDLTPCEEQEDSNVCINCLVIDNFLNVAINEGKRMAGYYEFTYVPVIIPSFVDYFNSPESEARSKAWREDMGSLMDKAAKKAVEKIDNAATELGNSISGDNVADTDYEAAKKGYKLQSKHKLFTNTTKPISEWKRAGKDWEHLFTKFEIRSGNNFIEVLKQFVSVTDDSYVEFFAHSLSWFATYPFAGECPVEIIYCSQPGYETTEKRLDLIMDSLIYMLYFLLAIFLADWFTNAPILALVTPWVGFILPFIFVLTTYGWIWPCFPNVPVCLFDDIFSFLNDRVFPNCWCQYYPALADSCNLENCFLCSVQTTYKECEDHIPELVELGFLWAPLTWLRMSAPKFLVFLYNTAPFLWLFRRLKKWDPIFQMAIYETPLNPFEKDCFSLHVGDIGLLIMAGYVLSTFLQFVAPIAMRAIQHGFKATLQLLGVLYSIAVCVELSTIAGVGSNTYQDGL